MSNYFSNFPTIQHDLTNIGQTVTLTNILRRFKVKNAVRERLDTYYTYDIQAGDRPDTLADKYYGDSGYAWVILHFNEIYDPFFNWPLFNKEFEDYIKGKYGSIVTAQATVHEYRRILTHKQTKVNGIIVPERYVVVDQTEYDTLGEIDKQSISKWDYEIEQNDKKRKIRILNKKYLNQIVAETEDILRNGV